MFTNDKIGIFGTGYFFQKNEKDIQRLSPTIFLDNDEKKNGISIMGIKVVCPNISIVKELDYIILMSASENEMKEQLLEMGVGRDKIIPYKDFRKFIFFLKDRTLIKEQYYEYNMISKRGNNAKRVLIITPSMNLNGASIAALKMAIMLEKNDISVVVLAPSTGRITAHFILDGIPVLFDEHLEEYNKDLFLFMESFDYVVLNSLPVQNLVYGVRDIDALFIWWLHESDYGFDSAKSDLVNYFSDNLQIYCVGDRVKTAVKQKWGIDDVKQLYYGVCDYAKENGDRWRKRNNRTKTIIACVGYISMVKAQDIFCRCLDYLDDSIRDKTEFWIVGRVLDKELFNQVQKYTEKYECIKYLGEYSPGQIQELYQKIDYLVCPSRRDSMPTVTVEAMMNFRIPIVSDVVGTATLITNEESGYLFRSEDAEDLARVIVKALNNEDKYELIARNARKIYETNFGMSEFEKKIKEIFA
jgi:glycosyltransferase involved in cell wall biosynthesis